MRYTTIPLLVLTLRKWQEVTDQDRAVCQYRDHSIGILLFKSDAFLGSEVFSSSHNAHTVLGRVGDGEGQLGAMRFSVVEDLRGVRAVEGLDEGAFLGMSATSWVTSLVGRMA